MKNIIIQSTRTWIEMDPNMMRMCRNLIINNTSFTRNMISFDHYFPLAENLLIDQSTPIPWLINQLVNDGRMPGLRNLFVTEDVSKYFISNAVKTFHLGKSENNKLYTMKDKETILYRMGTLLQ